MTDFEALYRGDPDPWAVRSSWYECRKRALLLASLPRERYRRGLELGCGNGETTRMLARRCDRLRAVDGSHTAVQCCREVLAGDGVANTQLAVLQLPHAWPLAPGEAVDLIVVSELAYYFGEPEMDAFAECCLQSLVDGGDWAMCHYKPDFHDRCLPTLHVHGLLERMPVLQRVVAHEDEAFRLDVWRKQAGAA